MGQLERFRRRGLTAVLFFSLAMICAVPGVSAAEDQTKGSGDVQSGATLAQKHNCLQCHGVLTNRFNPRLPYLAGQNLRYLQKQLRAFRSSGPVVLDGERIAERYNHMMEGRAAALDGQEIRDLAAYFSARRCRPPERSEAVRMPPQVQSCKTCHGLEGRGALADYPNLAGQKRAYLERQLGYFSGLARRPDGRPGRFHEVMSPMALNLSHGEIFELSTYYASQSCR